MIRCEGCGALYPDWFLAGAAASAAYDGYYTATGRRGAWRGWTRRLANRARRAYLDRAMPARARRILDYGCGAGDYLARFAERDCYGVDPFAPRHGAAPFAWLEAGDIAAAAPFDWITMGHVLEHLTDPSAALAHLAGALAPGGGLWIATPNADSFLFTAAGPWARDIDFPRHREVFSRRGLERLAAKAGLTCQFISPPRLNAALNAAATARNIVADGQAGGLARARALLATLLGLARHLARPKATRDRDAPELIAVCRLR